MNLLDLPLDELKTYRPDIPLPDDFEAFWSRHRARSAEQPLNPRVEAEPYALPSVRVATLSFDGYRNSRIHARLVMPAEGAVGDRVAVVFHGYDHNNAQPSHAFRYTLQGIATLQLDVRGQSMRSPDHNAYPSGGAAGWLTQGVLDPDEHYYTLVYMDCVRAIEAMIEHLELRDPEVIVEGMSQGGGLALATGYLSGRASVVLSDVPFLCHFRRAVEIATDGPYDEIYHFFKIQDPLHRLEGTVYRTLSYLDGVNMARFITVPTLVSVGLEDTICPPSTVFAAYNHLPGPGKALRIYPDWAHGGFSLQDEEKIAFVAEHLGTAR